jgi:aspartate carbamoyltransferase catalytic subunit
VTLKEDDEVRQNQLTYYANQIYEMDLFVAELTRQLKDFNEPCILVMYGDHLPSLGIEETDMNQGNLFTTKYILWSNFQMEKQDKKSLPSLDEYKRLFRIDENLLRYAKKDAIVMHPGPIQRGIEISSGVIDSKQCIINDQIGNSVAVRMAMFYILSQVGGAFR